MKKLSIILFLIFLFAGCSNDEQPLITGKKARLVREEMPDIPKCTSYRNRLLLPIVDDVEIEKIYQDATKSGCINKDI